MIALGVMSGTSCDGVDAVLIPLRSISEPHEPELLAHVHQAFPGALQQELLRPDALTAVRLAELHFELPELYARAVKRIPGFEAATCCGMHGQTIWHQPLATHTEPRGVACTLQIGSSAVLAARIGLPVVGDLRGLDVALGGQGAPIVPLAHWFFTPSERKPCAVVNFGGIANVSILRPELDDVNGYDVGPGMMISDAHAKHATRGQLAFDRDGQLSATGQIIPALLDEMMSHPFLKQATPKSTGREAFGVNYSGPLLTKFASSEIADVAYTILAATAEAVAQALEREEPSAANSGVVLTGGGAQNPTLVAILKRRLKAAQVSVDDQGVFSASCHEAAAVALIAARTFEGLPSSLPRVTGATRAGRLGHIHWA